MYGFDYLRSFLNMSRCKDLHLCSDVLCIIFPKDLGPSNGRVWTCIAGVGSSKKPLLRVQWSVGLYIEIPTTTYMQILQAVHWKVHLFLNGLDGLMSWISSCPTSGHPPKKGLNSGPDWGIKDYAHVAGMFFCFFSYVPPKKSNGFFLVLFVRMTPWHFFVPFLGC